MKNKKTNFRFLYVKYYLKLLEAKITAVLNISHCCRAKCVYLLNILLIEIDVSVSYINVGLYVYGSLGKLKCFILIAFLSNSACVSFGLPYTQLNVFINYACIASYGTENFFYITNVIFSGVSNMSMATSISTSIYKLWQGFSWNIPNE